MTVTQRSVCVLALSLLIRPVRRASIRRPSSTVPAAGALGTQAARRAACRSDRRRRATTREAGRYAVSDRVRRTARTIATFRHGTNLTNPNQIEVDQLRVVPPGANTAALTPGVSTRADRSGGGAVQSAPLGGTPPTAGVAAPPIYGSGANNASRRRRPTRAQRATERWRVRQRGVLMAGAWTDARHIRRFDQQGH